MISSIVWLYSGAARCYFSTFFYFIILRREIGALNRRGDDLRSLLFTSIVEAVPLHMMIGLSSLPCPLFLCGQAQQIPVYFLKKIAPDQTRTCGLGKICITCVVDNNRPTQH